MDRTSNFRFLSPQWSAVAEAGRVEAQAHPDPRTACFYARRALELAVDWLFDHDAAFRRPYDRNLAALLAEPSFAANVPGPVALKARVIRDLYISRRGLHTIIQYWSNDRVTQPLFPRCLPPSPSLPLVR